MHYPHFKWSTATRDWRQPHQVVPMRVFPPWHDVLLVSAGVFNSLKYLPTEYLLIPKYKTATQPLWSLQTSLYNMWSHCTISMLNIASKAAEQQHVSPHMWGNEAIWTSLLCGTPSQSAEHKPRHQTPELRDILRGLYPMLRSTKSATSPDTRSLRRQVHWIHTISSISFCH